MSIKRQLKSIGSYSFSSALTVTGAVWVALLAGLVRFVTSLWMLHAEKWLNDQYPSDQRATLVSVDNMAYSVLMIPASPLVGLVGDVTGCAGAGLCLLGAAVALSAAGALAHKKIPL